MIYNVSSCSGNHHGVLTSSIFMLPAYVKAILAGTKTKSPAKHSSTLSLISNFPEPSKI